MASFHNVYPQVIHRRISVIPGDVHREAQMCHAGSRALTSPNDTPALR